MEQLSKPK